MIKTYIKTRLRAFITLSNILTLLLSIFMSLSCARYISYQEKVKNDKTNFGPLTCEKNYTNKSDVIFAPVTEADIFKEFRQKKNLNFSDSIWSLSAYQQSSRPDIINTSSRVQIFIGHQDKIYYGEAVSADDKKLASPLFFLLRELLTKINPKFQINKNAAYPFNDVRVGNGLATFLKKNKGAMVEFAVKNPTLKNYFFKGENVLAIDESYPIKENLSIFDKYSTNPKDYQYKIEEVMSSGPNSKSCKDFEAKNPQDFFSLNSEYSKEIRHHQFGISLKARGEFFLALIQEGPIFSSFPNSPMIMAENVPSAPWCIHTNDNSLSLVVSLAQKNPKQILQSFLRDNTQNSPEKMLERLKNGRFLFVNPPLRVLSELVSEDETLTEIEKLPLMYLKASIQQIPIYHQDRVGEIIGLLRGETEQTFFFDARNSDKYMTCPLSVK